VARMGDPHWRRGPNSAPAARNLSFTSSCRDRWRNPPAPGSPGFASSANGLDPTRISGLSTDGILPPSLGHRRSLSGALELQLRQ
jgi:hypothetical protein